MRKPTILVSDLVGQYLVRVLPKTVTLNSCAVTTQLVASLLSHMQIVNFPVRSRLYQMDFNRV